MKKSNFVLLIALVAFMFTACENQGQYLGFKKNEVNGLYYAFHNTGTDTASAKVGDVMDVHMVYRTMNDSVFGGSQVEPFKVPMMEQTYEGDVFNALAMMHIGDSATFIMNTDSFFLKTVGAPRPEFLDSASTFYLDIQVVDIKNKEQMDLESQKQAAQMQAMEQELIAKYLVENNVTVAPNAEGLYIIEKNKGNGALLTVGSFVDANIIATALSGDKFIDTYAENKPYTLEVGTGQLGNGFEVAIKGMKKGGKLTLISPSSMAFGEKGIQGYIPPFSPVVYEIEILSVMTAEEMKVKRDAEQKKAAEEASKMQGDEQAKIDAYVKSNGITATPTATGLIFVSVAPGTGAQPTTGQKVKVHYTGFLLDGTKFDSSVDRGQPFEFVLGQGQVIQGWDEALSMMHVGEKVKIVIPSRIAYGERGAGASIPPFAPLMFEVELLEIVNQ